MSIKKGRASFRISTTCLIIFLSVFAAFLAGFNFLPPFSTHQHYIVASASMAPFINVGDVVFVDPHYPPQKLRVGDIVAFYQDINGNGKKEVVIHYIASIMIAENNQRLFRTKPENATSAANWDPWTVTQQDIIGRHAFQINRVGNVLLFIQSPLGRMVIFIDFVSLLFLMEYWKERPKEEDSGSVYDKG